jgi:hypothetical protein
VKHVIDFRQVYATVLEELLSCPSETVLGGRFERLPLLEKACPPAVRTPTRFRHVPHVEGLILTHRLGSGFTS